MKEKLGFLVALAISTIVGVLIGTIVVDTAKYFLLPRQQCHVCTCEVCKVKRQLETCEVLDSIFHSKIQIEINKK